MARPNAVLVLNAGSSSLKYRLFQDGAAVTGGLVERIGEPGGPVADHVGAFASVIDQLGPAGRRLDAVGHRVVHGGSRFRRPVLVDEAVLAEIEALTPLAPLHNPAGVAGIRAALRLVPDAAQVAVFDTAFHATLPPAAFTYALDRGVAEAHGIRRYGFHGISVEYVVHATAGLLGRPVGVLNLVVLHLGNGASATAVAGGRSVETSMGLTPLEGLVMGTRCGDIDPAVVFHLARSAGMDLAAVEDLYLHHGGLAGLSGENDLRAVERRMRAGDPDASLALDVYCHRIRKYVGAYYAVLGRVDGIVFTAGVGQHNALVRRDALTGLQALGIVLDERRNDDGPAQRIISADGSRVAVCVVPTDEEHAIAGQASDLLAHRP